MDPELVAFVVHAKRGVVHEPVAGLVRGADDEVLAVGLAGSAKGLEPFIARCKGEALHIVPDVVPGQKQLRKHHQVIVAVEGLRDDLYVGRHIAKGGGCAPQGDLHGQGQNGAALGPIVEAPTATPQEWEAIIATFVRDHVRRAGCNGVVLGLSGGLDSAVVARLCARALGPENVLGLIMPSASSDPLDAEHGRLSAEAAGIAWVERPIQGALDALAEQVDLSDAAVAGNAKARLRMIMLYAEAQAAGRLVTGTGNKSELLIGYFSKHGDGGVDMQPIGDLYKTQVRELARQLGVPDAIISKPPSAGLWPGQTDEQELGMDYATLDRILKGMELNQSPADIAAHTGLALEQIHDVDRRVRSSEHKRRAPLVPKIGIRTVGVDWRRPVHWDD